MDIKSSKEDKSISFSLIKIQELSFSYKEPFSFLKTDTLEERQIGGKFDVNYRWNLEKELFAVKLDFSFVYSKDKSQEEELLKLTFQLEFHIEKMSDVFTVRAPHDFDINETLEKTLVGLTISTGRGILFEKTKGTFFSKFVMPVIDPSDIILSKKFKARK